MALSSLTPLRPSPWRPRPLPAPWRENREPRRPSWATSVPEQPLSCRQRVPSEVSSADSHAVTELRGVAVTPWGHPPALKLSRPTWAAHVRPSSVPRAPAWAEVTGAWAGCVVGPPAAHGELGTLGSGPRSTWGQSLSRRLASSPSSGMWPGVGQGTGGDRAGLGLCIHADSSSWTVHPQRACEASGHDPTTLDPGPQESTGCPVQSWS